MQRADVIDRLNTGDPGVAVTMLRRLLDVNPEDADLLGLLGLALEESGDVSGAEAALRRASELPSAIAIRLRNGANLAHLLFDAGRRTEAAALLQEGWLWPHDRAPEPNECKAIAGLAEAMLKLGLHDEAAALLAPVSEVAALDWPLLKPLLTAMAQIGQTAEALKRLETHDTSDAPEHEREALRAHLLRANGKLAEAVRARKNYLKRVPPVILPPRDSQKLTVGLIDNPPSQANLLKPWPLAYFAINYPAQMAHLLSDRYRMAAIFCGAGDDAVMRFKSWRPDVVINNVTNAEMLMTGENLAEVESFIARITPRAINPPSAAINCTRQKNPANLAGIDGLILPSIRRFLCDLKRLNDLVDRIEAETAYPMIVRTVYDQESQNMILVHCRADLVNAIGKLNRAQIYIVSYLGRPRDRGFYRRLRSFFVGGQPIILWADYASTWIVRSRRYIDLQTYRDHPDLFEKANAIISNPRAELGERAMSALEAVGRTIPLDIFGMDFDVDEEGNVVFFETNATMGMKVPVPEAFAYPPEAIERLTAALDGLLLRVAERRRNCA